MLPDFGWCNWEAKYLQRVTRNDVGTFCVRCAALLLDGLRYLSALGALSRTFNQLYVYINVILTFEGREKFLFGVLKSSILFIGYCESTSVTVLKEMSDESSEFSRLSDIFRIEMCRNSLE